MPSCPRPRKRALRGRASPLQAHHRKDRPSDRASRPRVLRKADRRAQAQEGRGREAPLQAPAQPAAAAQAVLTRGADRIRTKGRSDSPLLRFVRPHLVPPETRHDPQGPHHRRHEGRDAREGRRAPVDDPHAARGDQAARGRRAQGAHRRRRARRHRQDDQAAPRLDRAVRGRQAPGPRRSRAGRARRARRPTMPQQLTRRRDRRADRRGDRGDRRCRRRRAWAR